MKNMGTKPNLNLSPIINFVLSSAFSSHFSFSRFSACARSTLLSLWASSPIWEREASRARGRISLRMPLARILFTICPNGKLARRLNATRPPFQSSQTQKQHVTYGENWSYSCIQLALLDIFNSEMWKLENRGKSVHDNKWFKPQWIQVMRFN